MCSTKKWSTHRLFLHQLENLKFWVCHYKVKPISAKSSLIGQFGSTVPASACSQHQMYRPPHPRIYGHYLGESFESKRNESKISVRGANSRCRTRTVHIFSSWPGAKGTQQTWRSDSQLLLRCGQGHSPTLSWHLVSLCVSCDHETFDHRHHWNVSLFKTPYK